MMDWPIFHIEAAPRNGTRQLVWVPSIPGSPGHWIFARWYVDPRPVRKLSRERAELVQRHGGYWSAHFSGGRPLRRSPTLYMRGLPDPEAA